MKSISGNVSLPLKMTLITLIVGIATWSLLDPFHRTAMKNSFGRQLNERIEQDAHENRMLFDGYINRYTQSVKLLISQKVFHDYVSAHAVEWASVPAGKDRIIYRNEPPVWLPASSIIRALPDMHYVFLLDKGKTVREVYLKHPESPPKELLEPSALLLQLTHDQAFMTELDNKPYMVVSAALPDAQGKDASTLLLADPLDNAFMLESQGAVYSHKLVALVGMDPSVIIASSHPEILAPGRELKDIEGDYWYTGRGFFDYGSSDLRMNFMTFLPIKPHEDLRESIMKEEQRNRIITALMLVLSFSVLMYWVTKRVRNITDKVSEFAEVKLKLKQPSELAGDEINVLEQRFLAMSDEVIASQESIKEQAGLLRQERDRAQNYLDIAASILLVIDSDGKVVMINRKGCDILGYREEELTGRDWFDTVMPPGSRHKAKTFFQEVIANKIPDDIYIESLLTTKNGENRLIGWRNTLLKDRTGIINGVLASGEDVTDRRKAEEELLQAHKMLDTRVRERTAELEKTNLLLNEEIAHRLQTENNLRNSEQKLEKAQAIAEVGSWDWNIQSGQVSWSDEVYRIYGYQPGEIDPDYEVVKKAMHPESIQEFLDGIDKALRGDHPFEMEYAFFRRDGKVSVLHTKGEVIRDSAGRPVKMFGVIQDITKRKQAEMQITASLKEKEVLLQEIHHRVKNNMTVISSLLKLQADKVRDKYYKELFNESINRIKSMALIHEKLYRSEDLAQIVFSEYLKDMMDSIIGSYGMNGRNILITKDLEKITLSLDTSIPCGLIVNELLSNSLKYAFPAGRNGEITVSLRKNNGNVELSVGDDGVGLPADLDFRKTGSLGLNIVNALVKQIRGDIKLQRERGTEFFITFRSDN